MERRTDPDEEERYTIGGVVYGLFYSHQPSSKRSHSYLATCPLCSMQIVGMGLTQPAALVSAKIRAGIHYRTLHRS